MRNFLRTRRRGIGDENFPGTSVRAYGLLALKFTVSLAERPRTGWSPPTSGSSFDLSAGASQRQVRHVKGSGVRLAISVAIVGDDQVAHGHWLAGLVHLVDDREERGIHLGKRSARGEPFEVAAAHQYARRGVDQLEPVLRAAGDHDRHRRVYEDATERLPHRIALPGTRAVGDVLDEDAPEIGASYLFTGNTYRGDKREEPPNFTPHKKPRPSIATTLSIASCARGDACRPAHFEFSMRNGRGFRDRERVETAIYFHCGGLGLMPR